MSQTSVSHVYLIGFMAVGKTSVGARAAAMAGRRFVDLDAEIAERAGCTIAEIFTERGEEAFRALEAEALRRVAHGAAAIVATGGGAACYGDNLQVMRKQGLVIALSATLATVRARIEEPAERPLLARSPAEVQALFAARAEFYRQAHACVATDELGIDGAAERVLAIIERAETLPAGLQGQTSFVALRERTYPIVVAPGVLGQVGAIVRASLPADCRQVALISDDNVGWLYGEQVEDSLSAAGFAVVQFDIPAGERSKSFAHFAQMCEGLAPRLDRRSAIVALGGGVVGDFAGLVAATLFRGIACVQIPTSLLAMTDSAIGGKTGINLKCGKNLVGAFWQPRAVIADPLVLATLPARELRAAFGELVKYGLLSGERLLAEMEALAPAVADGRVTAESMRARVAAMIARCAADKGWIVTRDEREQTGERALLNLGHTVGHAIEAAGEFRALLHGEAVALGLLAACRLSVQLELCDRDLLARVAAILTRAGLSTDLQPWLRADVLALMKTDKKRAGDTINFVAIHAPGDCRCVPLSLDKIARKLLADFTV